MNFASQLGAAAVGLGPVGSYGLPAGGNARVLSDTVVPSFPDPDLLGRMDFKVTVASWQRMEDPECSGTGDFQVNVGAYAPKQALVTGTHLVDVDIPNTQLLIEKAWSKSYFSLGLTTSAEDRSLSLSHPGPGGVPCTATVLMPLPMDAVTGVALPSQAVVRVFLEHRAPTPIQELAASWPGLVLVGVPGLGTFRLLPAEVDSDTPMSIVIHSAVLFNAFSTAVGPAPAMMLCASPLAGPAMLANIASLCLSASLNERDGQGAWAVDFTYRPVSDTFTLNVRSPGPLRLVLEGGISCYMGFGPHLLVERCVAAAERNAGSIAFADLRCGDTKLEVELAAWWQAAFQGFLFPSFSFGVVFPGLPQFAVLVPAGCYSMDSLTSSMEQRMGEAGLPAVVLCRVSPQGPVFSSEARFFLDWTVDTVFQPERLGYDRATTGLDKLQCPAFSARHIPLMPPMCGQGRCELPPCLVTVDFHPATNQVTLQTRPLPAFVASSVVAAVSMPANVVLATSTGGYVHGLRAGARVLFSCSAPAYAQLAAVVLDSDDTQFRAVLLQPADAVTLLAFSSSVTVSPTDAPPLALYMQRAEGRFPDCLDSAMFGFQPETYQAKEPCFVLLSPGTMEVSQDAFVLVCLGFNPGADASTGDMYFPLAGLPQGRSTMVFAKVARNVFLRSTFDSKFDFYFAGMGTFLGYIRVRILNGNGTPYQTHGHPVAVTLRMDARADGLAQGGGHVVVPGSNGYLHDNPISRGTVFMRG